MESGHRGLRVYQLSYKMAMKVFQLTKSYPKEEKYSLVTQIRNSSRSVSANIAEGYRKRRYPKHFSSKISDADAESTETQVWLEFSKDCGYIPSSVHADIVAEYQIVGDMLGKMINNPDKFLPKELRDNK